GILPVRFQRRTWDLSAARGCLSNRRRGVRRCRGGRHADLNAAPSNDVRRRSPAMKYMVLIAGPEDPPGAASAASPQRAAAYERILGWWQEQSRSGKVLEGYELQPSLTATTVRRDEAGNVTVTDGPFLEAKEMVGGYAIIDVADLDEAISLVSGWPSSATLEIRPVVTRD